MRLVAIGNSKGVRIPSALIMRYGFDQGVTILEEKDGIKILPAKQSIREGWGSFYKANALKMDADTDFLEFGIEDELE